MRTYIQDGRVITVPAPAGGAVSGQGYQIGQCFGIAASSVAAGEPLELQVMGVFEMPKAEGEVWTPGELLYWDAVEREVTAVAGLRLLIGAATAQAGAESATGSVRLNGVAVAQTAEQSVFLYAADDVELSALVGTLGSEDEGRLIIVENRSGQGPQVLHVAGGQPRALIGMSATVTITMLQPSGAAVVVGSGASVNLASATGAGVRSSFPAGAWNFDDYELVAPATGYVRTALTIKFNVSAPCVVAFVAQSWSGSEWEDAATTIAQEVAPQTIPYQLTGFDELLVPAGARFRLVVRHDANASRTVTVYKVVSISNYVFSAEE